MIIKRGDRGENVKRLQRALNRFGFNLEEDGIFGGGTDTAVREFQNSNNLDVDGQAGPNTLRALGLDPDTLEEVGGGGDGGEEEEVIIFEPDEVEEIEVPKHFVADKIGTFVKLLGEQHDKMLLSLLNALAQFETTMSFASEKEANPDPDVLGVLVSKAFELAWDKVVSKVPALEVGKVLFDVAKELFDATTAELERAGKASESFQVGIWIKDQRAEIDTRLRGEVTQAWRDRVCLD